MPVRECCTELVGRAVRLVAERPDGSTRFVTASDRNAAGRIAASLPIADGMSLRRARATWLTAHLVAGTPLPVLREIAGPLSVATLDDLLAASGHAVNPEQAVHRGAARMRRRAQLRRVNRRAAQQCLTIADAARLDATRRLCDDFPSIQKAKRRQQTGEQITDAQLDTLRSEVEEVSWAKAHPILMAVRRSKKFKELQQQAHSHPGPRSSAGA